MNNNKTSALDWIRIPYRKGENIEELVKYKLSDILPYDKDDFYFKYSIIGNQLQVQYAKEKKDGKGIKATDIINRNRKISSGLIAVLLVLLFINCWSLRYKQYHFRQNFNSRIYLCNSLYHKKNSMIESKRIKRKNLKIIELLQQVLILPVHIQYLMIKPNHFELNCFSTEFSDIEIFSQLSKLIITPQVKYAMQKDIIYLYIKGFL